MAARAAGSSRAQAILILDSDSDNDNQLQHQPQPVKSTDNSKIRPLRRLRRLKASGKVGDVDGEGEGGVGVGDRQHPPPAQSGNNDSDHDDDDGEIQNRSNDRPKRKRPSSDKLKEVGNGQEAAESSNKGKGKAKEKMPSDKGKSRAISPRIRHAGGSKDDAGNPSITIESDADDDEADDSIVFKGSSKPIKKSKPSSSSNHQSNVASSSKHKINPSSSKNVLQSEEPLDQLLQIFPDLDEEFAKKHMAKVQDELAFTDKGQGNEMVMSRALEQLMNLPEGYPKKKPGNQVAQESSEDEFIEISETEDEEEEGAEKIPCGCCFDDELPFKKLIPCSFGLHRFCPDCCRRTFEQQLGLRKCKVTCMDSSTCDAEFDPKQIKKFLPKKQLKLLENLIMENEIETAGLKEGLEVCPWCDFACIIERSKEEEKLFRCQGRGCGRVSCRSCKEEDHLPLSCKEFADSKSDGSRHKMEEALTQILIRKCPTENCGTILVKDDGCNKIHCPKCHKYMCYVCRISILDYSHFDQNPANYRQAKEVGKCPLWEDTDARHKQEQDEYRKKMGEVIKDVGGSAAIRERPAGWAPAHIARARQGGYQILPDGRIEAGGGEMHDRGAAAQLYARMEAVRAQLHQAVLPRVAPNQAHPGNQAQRRGVFLAPANPQAAQIRAQMEVMQAQMEAAQAAHLEGVRAREAQLRAALAARNQQAQQARMQAEARAQADRAQFYLEEQAELRIAEDDGDVMDYEMENEMEDWEEDYPNQDLGHIMDVVLQRENGQAAAAQRRRRADQRRNQEQVRRLQEAQRERDRLAAEERRLDDQMRRDEENRINEYNRQMEAQAQAQTRSKPKAARRGGVANRLQQEPQPPPRLQAQAGPSQPRRGRSAATPILLD